MDGPMVDGAIYDVIQVGYGPVSGLLAVEMGRQGWRVAIFERWKQRYALPRAVCIDHEIYRVMSALGMGKELARISHAAPPYIWYNADWKELLSIDWSAESVSGGPDVYFVHQPTMEAMVDQFARTFPNIEVNLGWEVVSITDHADFAELVARDVDTGETRTARARIIIGADGANSVVRRAIGSAQEDRGFQADWLVLDLLPNEGVELDVPPAAQWCNPERPTTIVPAGLRDGRRYRRWEFMRLPHETIADIETEEAGWRMLAPWVRPDQATMVRHKVYTFRSLLAETWRSGRLMIVGDAAHVMPPFMGQGMCSGLRDGWNLAWKLDLILRGRAGLELLDSYQEERSPHVSTIIDMSMYLGRMICQPDLARAAERDQAFFDGSHPPFPPFPHLSDGLLQRDASGQPTPVAGLLGPQGRIRRDGRDGWFDELVGLGTVLVTRGALPALDAPTADVVDRLGVRIVDLTAPGTVDLDGKYGKFLDEHKLACYLVRPDFYLFGGAASLGEAPALLESFGQAISGGTVPVSDALPVHALH